MLKPQREGGGKRKVIHLICKELEHLYKTLKKSLNFCSYKNLTESLRFSFHIFGAVWMGEIHKCTSVSQTDIKTGAR